MNVLIVSAVFPPEPVVSSLLSYDIANDLTEKGNNVTVICPRPTRPYGYEGLNDNITSVKFNKVILNSFTCPKSSVLGRFRESYSFGLHCFNFIRKNYKNIDVVYANSWPLFSQYFIVKAANKHNIPVILHIQDVYPESIAEKQSSLIRLILIRLFTPLDKYILTRCSKIITISPSMREYLVNSRHLDKSNIFVVRNWQNDSRFLNLQHIYKNKDAEFVFMYLGSINPSASIETLIHAFGQGKLPNSKLIIAGEGAYKPNCVKIAKQYQDANIEFITAPVDQVHILQQQADVLLLPLKKGIAKTATPSKLSAYMFSGKPIIACVDENSDIANCILDANCGVIIEPENQDKLLTSMKSLINEEKTILENLGKNGRKYALVNLSRSINLKKMSSILTEEQND